MVDDKTGKRLALTRGVAVVKRFCHHRYIGPIMVVFLILLVVFAVLLQIRLIHRFNNLELRFESIQNKSDSLALKVSSMDGIIATLESRSELNELMDDLERDLKGSVDLSTQDIQDIGHGFKVVGLSVTEHLTGVKVKGRIINATSLAHESLIFKITIGAQTKEFSISRISSGHSTGFNVYLPNVPTDRTSYGKIEYVRSFLRYYH